MAEVYTEFSHVCVPGWHGRWSAFSSIVIRNGKCYLVSVVQIEQVSEDTAPSLTSALGTAARIPADFHLISSPL
jgi:hypothetical protein